MVALTSPAAPLGRTATVLVVDDNPALRHSAQAMLAPAGFGCVAVADSISALCALVEHRPRAVLLDLLLAEADPDPAQDAQLSSAMQALGNVVLPAGLLPQATRTEPWLKPAQALGAHAVLAHSDAAPDADGHRLRGVAQRHAVGIDHRLRMTDVTAEADGEVPARRVVVMAALGDRLGDAEIALALRHLADLDVDPLRIEERGIDVPARACAGMA